MIRVTVDETRYRGNAIDLRGHPVDADTVHGAIHGDDGPVTVRCSGPGPVHDRLGVIRPGRCYPIRAALALVARQRGHDASVDPELATVREELAAIDPPSVSTEAQRRRLAESDGGTDLETRVAELRGRIAAARTGADDADVEALQSELETVTTRLVEHRTDRIAAEQALSSARQAARRARDRRERRLELRDRERNLQRRARRELAATVEREFARALSVVPGACRTGDAPGTVDGDQTTAALAVCRLATIAAPVVLACDRFDSADAAASTLDAPVVLVAE